MSGHFTSGQCQYKVIVWSWSWIALNFEVVPGRGVMPPQFDLQTFLDAGGSSQPQRNTLSKDNVHRTPVAGRQQLQLQRYDVTESESDRVEEEETERTHWWAAAIQRNRGLDRAEARERGVLQLVKRKQLNVT